MVADSCTQKYHDQQPDSSFAIQVLDLKANREDYSTSIERFYYDVFSMCTGASMCSFMAPTPCLKCHLIQGCSLALNIGLIENLSSSAMPIDLQKLQQFFRQRLSFSMMLSNSSRMNIFHDMLAFKSWLHIITSFYISRTISPRYQLCQSFCSSLLLIPLHGVCHCNHSFLAEHILYLLSSLNSIYSFRSYTMWSGIQNFPQFFSLQNVSINLSKNSLIMITAILGIHPVQYWSLQ